MADVENVNLLVRLHDAVNHTIDMRFVAIKQVPEILAFGSKGAAFGVLLQGEQGNFQALEPSVCRLGSIRLYHAKDEIQIAFRAGQDVGRASPLRCAAGIRRQITVIIKG